jgi:hypothetical protein
VEDAVFDPTTFSKNRERLLNHLVAKLFFQAVLDEARRHHLLSIQHFTVDGTLLESWASLKSLERKPNLGGRRRSRRRGRREGSKTPHGGGRNPTLRERARSVAHKVMRAGKAGMISGIPPVTSAAGCKARFGGSSRF